MTRDIERLRSFLDHAPQAALVEVTEAKGSTPRETGAHMLVSPQAIFGTIGGGHLEFLAIDRARQLLAGSLPARGAGEGNVNDGHPPRRGLPRQEEGTIILDIPLGPEIGQCCGGRVGLTIRQVDEALRAKLVAQAEADDAARPRIYVFGGGHVGHALASAFALLPVHVVVVETRADQFEDMPETVETRLTPVPEEMVREAPAGSAFVVLTHDHALDFLIVAEALKRDDAAYVGMIGSKTKKATFRSWFLKTAGGTEQAFARLVSPIGGDAVKDKRPPVIAALAAAEIMTALVGTRD